MARLNVGIDVGGTFTDFAIFDPDSQTVSVGKTLSTAQNPSVGVVRGAREVFEGRGVSIADASQVVHGTTVVANLVLERKGARVGLITTDGFRDVLEAGTEERYDMYDLSARRAEPLVPRYLRRGVSERVNWQGEVLKPLDLAEVDPIMDLFQREGVETIAVCLIHSYRNPAHEQQIRDYISRRYPKYPISISSEVAPEVREYPRASTTVVNAYVQPLLARYLSDTETGLNDLGFGGTTYLMLSEGGVTTLDVARSLPVRLAESGPAAGAVAAAYYGKLLGHKNILSFDMGGTTAKLCVITDGQPSRSNEIEIAREARFRKGSGLVLRIPSIEMIEIGAGGGSIAHIDPMGLLKVGPLSAGAEPGPACYSLGGVEPTVTDADLVLGHLDPDYFLGGEMRLDPDAARHAIREKLADPMGMDVVRAAQGVHDVVNENMATAARIKAAEQGVDVRKYVLVAFGGAGPVHAHRVARLLGVQKIVCPMGAGVMSSIGMLVAPKSFDSSQSYVSRLDRLDWDRISSIYRQLEARAMDLLEAAAVDLKNVSLTRSADMRYVGQGFEIAVPVPGGNLSPNLHVKLVKTFNESYDALFGRHLTEVPVEAITWRLNASEPPPEPEIRFQNATGSRYPGGVKGRRPVYFPEAGGFVDCPVLDRYSLEPGSSVQGPAIVEERESTVVVGADARCRIDLSLNLVMELG